MNKRLSYFGSLVLMLLWLALPTIAQAQGEGAESAAITHCRYWIDQDYEHNKIMPYTSDNFNINIDYSSLSEGAHSLNFAFKNAEGVWSNTENCMFVVPQKSSATAKEEKQPINAFRYGVNGKCKMTTIGETLSIPSLTIDIPTPNLQDILQVKDYVFTMDNSSNDVKVKRNTSLTYYVQFRDKAGNWGAPMFLDSITGDSTVKTAKDLEQNKTLSIKKIGKSEYEIVKFNVLSDQTCYLGTSEKCDIMLYKDNALYTTFAPEQSIKNDGTWLNAGTYFAVVYNQDADGSIRFATSKNWVADPQFSYANHQLSISCAQEGATIYYTLDGSEPSSTSTKYSGPISMDYNAIVKAVAYYEGMADSHVKYFMVDDFEKRACATPTVSYDGRTIKLASQDTYSDIYYTTDGSTPTSESILYNAEEGIHVTDIGTIKALATKDFMIDSEVLTFAIPAFYDGASTIKVQTAGGLSKSLEWCQNVVQSDHIHVSGSLNATDIAFLKELGGIKYLDLDKVSMEGNMLPDQAFANTSIMVASLPASLTSCGKDLFAGNKLLAAVVWNANSELPAEALSGINNPNLLLYVNSKSNAPSSFVNVIAGGVADNIVLSGVSAYQTSAGNFNAPTPFTAKKISYTRNFKQETEVGICQGWETIALPFEAQTITHETNGKIAPFTKGEEGAKPFWLYELAPNGGFQPVVTLKANTPYIISMPNSQAYSDDYILGGNVTFSAENVEIAATEQASAKNDNREFVTSFEQVDKALGIYALNVGEEYQGYRPGSLFVENLVTVHPFEAYLTTPDAAAKFSMQFSKGTTGIDNIPTKQLAGINAWAEGSTLYISSDAARRVPVFNTSGMLVKSISVEAGETTSITDLPSGIYIVNKKKVAIQ